MRWDGSTCPTVVPVRVVVRWRARARIDATCGDEEKNSKVTSNQQ
ncbi:unnamed protein product, partial [Callosobruchus maculatus]